MTTIATQIQKMRMINHLKVLTVTQNKHFHSNISKKNICLDDSSDYDSEDVNNVTIDEENSDDSEDAAGEEDKDDDDDLDEEGALKGHVRFRDIMKHGPGMDSGCTAVVAVLRGNELYVANAGDSRCVICRNGTRLFV